MFSGGIGTIDASFVQKNTPEVGMSVVKVGGPVYRLDMSTFIICCLSYIICLFAWLELV